MKRLFYLTIFMILISCNQENQKAKGQQINTSNKIIITVESNQYYDVQDIDCKLFKSIKRKEKLFFIADTLRFRKNNNELVLPIADGKNITFTDTLTNVSDTDYSVDFEAYRKFHYLGYFPKINFYVVRLDLYEESYYYLVDIQTGQKTEIGGFPKLSLNQNYLMNENEMGGFADNQFGFQIWKFNKENRTLTEIFTLEQENWRPIDFVWIENETALIKVISLESNDYEQDNYDNSTDCLCKKIIMKSLPQK